MKWMKATRLSAQIRKMLALNSKLGGESPRRGDLRVLQILWNGGEDKLLS